MTPTGRASPSRLRLLADEIYMDEKVEDYILNIVQAMRTPSCRGAAT